VVQPDIDVTVDALVMQSYQEMLLSLFGAQTGRRFKTREPVFGVTLLARGVSTHII
jgi:hypothetical protein